MKRKQLRHFDRERIIWDSPIDPLQKLILLAYNTFLGANDTCWPSHTVIATMTGLSDTTIKNHIKKMRQANIISTKERLSHQGKKARTSNETRINWELLENKINTLKGGAGDTPGIEVGQEIPQGGVGGAPGVGQEIPQGGVGGAPGVGQEIPQGGAGGAPDLIHRSNPVGSNQKGSDPKKRERDARTRKTEPVENSSNKPDYAIQPIAIFPSEANTNCATAPPSSMQNFDFEVYNWAEYSKPGSGGSDPEYFAWAVAQVTQYSDTRQSQGKPSVGDIGRYTIATIQNRGAEGYKKFLATKHPIPPSPQPNSPKKTKDLVFIPPTLSVLPTYEDLGLAIATIQTNMELRHWGWATYALQLWVCSAQEHAKRAAWPSIDFKPALGLSNWPDWAIAKLAEDFNAHA